MGVELVVVYVFGWLVSKARRAGRRLDGHVDDAVDIVTDRLGEKLHTLVAGGLGQDSAFKQLEAEAGKGQQEPSERTARRMADALTQATEDDPQLAAALDEALSEAGLDASIRVHESRNVRIEDSAIASGNADVKSRATIGVERSSGIVIERSAQTKFTTGE
jgi:hypothetical protein